MFGKGRRKEATEGFGWRFNKLLDHVKSVLMCVIPLSHKVPLLLSTTGSFQRYDVYGPRARSRAPMSPRYLNLCSMQKLAFQISPQRDWRNRCLLALFIFVTGQTDREPPLVGPFGAECEVHVLLLLHRG